MVDVAALVEDLGELVSCGAAGAVIGEEDVRAEGRVAGGDLPDVQVVHGPDVWLGGEQLPDLIRMQARRGCLEEHPAGVPEKPVGGAQHQGGDQERCDRVCSLPGREDHATGDGGRDERVGRGR